MSDEVIIVRAKIKIEKTVLFFENSMQNMFYHGASYGYIYSLNKVFEKRAVKDIAQNICNIINRGFPATVYALKKDVLFEITIESNTEGDFMIVRSLDPVKTFEDEKNSIDMSFYILLCVELCENFAIYELTAEQV